MSQITKAPSGLLDRFFKKLTLAELKSIGFNIFVDRSTLSTTLRSNNPFFWAYPDALEECDHDKQLLGALEKCHFDGEFFTVIANGVLVDTDVFPFAIFQINAIEKPIDMSAPSVREMFVPAERREKFEESVFSARFIGSIERTGKAGDLYLQSIGCPAKADFLRRTQDGMDYCDETVSAMWFGFKLALLSSAPRATERSLPARPLYEMNAAALSAVKRLSSLSRAVLHQLLSGHELGYSFNDYGSPNNPITELYAAGLFGMISSRDRGGMFFFSISPANRPRATALAFDHGVTYNASEPLVDCLGAPATMPTPGRALT